MKLLINKAIAHFKINNNVAIEDITIMVELYIYAVQYVYTRNKRIEYLLHDLDELFNETFITIKNQISSILNKDKNAVKSYFEMEELVYFNHILKIEFLFNTHCSLIKSCIASDYPQQLKDFLIDDTEMINLIDGLISFTSPSYNPDAIYIYNHIINILANKEQKLYELLESISAAAKNTAYATCFAEALVKSFNITTIMDDQFLQTIEIYSMIIFDKLYAKQDIQKQFSFQTPRNRLSKRTATIEYPAEINKTISYLCSNKVIINSEPWLTKYEELCQVAKLEASQAKLNDLCYEFKILSTKQKIFEILFCDPANNFECIALLLIAILGIVMKNHDDHYPVGIDGIVEIMRRQHQELVCITQKVGFIEQLILEKLEYRVTVSPLEYEDLYNQTYNTPNSSAKLKFQ